MSKVKHRSPYAKSLELRQYRHRVQEEKKQYIDNWIEDALKEYYDELETKEDTNSQENTTPRQDEGDGNAQDVGVNGEVVEEPDKEIREDGGHTDK